jgi:hypothetical protein
MHARARMRGLVHAVVQIWGLLAMSRQSRVGCDSLQARARWNGLMWHPAVVYNRQRQPRHQAVQPSSRSPVAAVCHANTHRKEVAASSKRATQRLDAVHMLSSACQRLRGAASLFPARRSPSRQLSRAKKNPEAQHELHKREGSHLSPYICLNPASMASADALCPPPVLDIKTRTFFWP